MSTIMVKEKIATTKMESNDWQKKLKKGKCDKIEQTEKMKIKILTY